ncbi:DUF2335 domain-containing protein [Acetobacter thailandicus]|uniref:DUF2335 domain-containing protein n=1 Tax=Acetobacter thailandicus TaxID=1502842 RepID=A0ABT3QHP3_9PROT|nr:DUF2335 domain-containing protein [Acetobacter thailandicus]MCX2564813.1 DUF2335 domain-containing protein [Acetobacter thailandicus]NHN96315.1 DUF2335 domain-containing protein [Acetobacter thailandicus]
MNANADSTPEEDDQSETESENTENIKPSEEGTVSVEVEAGTPVTLKLTEVPRTINSLPPYMFPPTMGQAALLHASSQQQQQHAWNAPVPPPEAAERFEKLCPGSFERMLRMAEKEQDNQIDLNQKQIAIAQKTSENQVILATRAQDFLATDTRRGHFLGALISVLAMTGAGAAEVYDQAAIGIAFLSVPIMTVAIAFINSHKSNKSTAKNANPQKNVEPAEKKEEPKQD